jgi:hypothetical protein
MFLPPSIGIDLVRQRQHDMQAQAGQQLRQDARASRRAGQTEDDVGWMSEILAQSKMRGRTEVRHVLHIFG